MLAAEGRDRLWLAVEDVLRASGFRLDRVDHREGVVTTWPNTSQQFFEFWRSDVRTGWDFWEASLNPIRRRAEVRLTSPEADEPASLMVRVYKQRLSSPDRQFNSSGAAYQFFGDNLPSTTGKQIVPEVDDHWIDLGRDHALEDSLLKSILARAGGVASPESGSITPESAPHSPRGQSRERKPTDTMRARTALLRL
jgi:hypothetical protein